MKGNSQLDTQCKAGKSCWTRSFISLDLSVLLRKKTNGYRREIIFFKNPGKEWAGEGEVHQSPKLEAWL